MYAFEAINQMTRAQAARRYYDLGWHVIPLHDKRPTTAWQTEPRLHPDALDVLFDDDTFNIGIVMGSKSQLLALDIDGETGRAMLPFDRPGQTFHTTARFSTPNNGLRLLYQYDPAVRTRSIRQNGKEAIRIMSNGTQTVAPPSTIEGKAYAWSSPDHLLPFPHALIAGIESRPSPIELPPHRPQHIGPVDKLNRAHAYVNKCEPAISGQGGHDQTFKIAVKLVKGFALTFHEAFSILAEYNERCLPPWSEDELQHKIEDALKVNAPYGSLL